MRAITGFVCTLSVRMNGQQPTQARLDCCSTNVDVLVEARRERRVQLDHGSNGLTHVVEEGGRELVLVHEGVGCSDVRCER